MMMFNVLNAATWGDMAKEKEKSFFDFEFITWMAWTCLLYTSPSPRDSSPSRMPSSA